MTRIPRGVAKAIQLYYEGKAPPLMYHMVKEAAKQKAIVEWAKSRTESNCGWGDYAVAQLILHEAAVIEHARKAKGAGT